MSATKMRAAADLRKLSMMFRGLVDVGVELEAVGSLEQAAAEAESSLTRTRGLVEAANAELVAASARVVGANRRAQQITDAATAAAADQAQAAERDAAALKTDAKAEAERIVQQALQRAAAITNSAKAAQQTLDLINGEITVQQGKLDDINTQIADLRRKF